MDYSYFFQTKLYFMNYFLKIKILLKIGDTKRIQATQIEKKKKIWSVKLYNQSEKTLNVNIKTTYEIFFSFVKASIE